MPRIRSVHPGLFTDEAFVSCSDGAQIFWIGLWTEADDQGVFEWKPVTLKMRLRPAATRPVDPLLTELSAAGMIKEFECDGRRYGVVRNFARHQRPKAPKDVHPLPTELRNYAGFNSDGSRPDATTGRKRFAHNTPSVRNEYGTTSESRSQMEEGEEDGGYPYQGQEPSSSVAQGGRGWTGEITDDAFGERGAA
jgi:hypothetical protein